MEKLNQIIESMALAQFRADINTTEKLNAFMLKHATLTEFLTYFTTKRDSFGRLWAESYSYPTTTLGNMAGLTEKFCREVLWLRLREDYIEEVVKSLEQKVEQSFKITIESI